MVICAHRGGAKGLHHENTIGAFKYALEKGLELIEFDVWLTGDDQIIVTHGGYNGELFLDN